MIEEEKLIGAIETILDNILTPVIYMYMDEVIEFVCFCDANVEEEALRKTEEIIYENYGISSEVLDIREFDESDRCDIVTNAELVYAVDDIVKMLFETAMFADIDSIMEQKRDAIKRKSETGTYYLN